MFAYKDLIVLILWYIVHRVARMLCFKLLCTSLCPSHFTLLNIIFNYLLDFLIVFILFSFDLLRLFVCSDVTELQTRGRFCVLCLTHFFFFC